MRVMIWGDMEGVACIQSWEQVTGGTGMYAECRTLFTNEMNAAVRGARAGGATDVTAIDCHGAGHGWSFQSLVPELMDEGAEWVLGHSWARYVEPLQVGTDAVLFVGAHARAGTPNGVLSHTVSSEAWYNAYLNGVPVGESGILAALCGVWDAPAVFVAGDVATCDEVQDLLGPTVVTAPVKIGLSRFSARSLTPGAACRLIEDRSRTALQARQDWPKPYKPASPVEFRVELATVDAAAPFRGRTGVEVQGRTVLSRGRTFWDAWNQFWYR